MEIEFYQNYQKRKLVDGKPCGHKGCLHHWSHPCEGCGRIGGFMKPKESCQICGSVLTLGDPCTVCVQKSKLKEQSPENINNVIESMEYIEPYESDNVDLIVCRIPHELGRNGHFQKFMSEMVGVLPEKIKVIIVSKEIDLKMFKKAVPSNDELKYLDIRINTLDNILDNIGSNNVTSQSIINQIAEKLVDYHKERRILLYGSDIDETKKEDQG